MELHPLNFITKEELNTLSTEELIKRLPDILANMNKANDSVVDCLDEAFYDAFHKKRLWIDYPLDRTDSVYSKLEKITISIENENYVVGLMDHVVFPVMFTNYSNDDITVGYIAIVVHETKHMYLYIPANTPKYLKELFDVNELTYYLPKYSDGAYEYVSDYIILNNTLNELTSLDKDTNNLPLIKKYNLDYLYDVERQDGIMLINAYIKAMKADNIILSEIKKLVSDYIEENHIAGIDIDASINGSELEIKIGNMDGSVTFSYDMIDDKILCSYLKKDNTPEVIKYIIKNKNRVKRDIYDTILPQFDDLCALMTVYKEHLSELSGDIIIYPISSEDSLVTGFDLMLLGKFPDEFSKDDRVLNVRDNASPEYYDEFLKIISDYAQKNPDVTEIKLRNNLYYRAIEEEH